MSMNLTTKILLLPLAVFGVILFLICISSPSSSSRASSETPANHVSATPLRLMDHGTEDVHHRSLRNKNMDDGEDNGRSAIADADVLPSEVEVVMIVPKETAPNLDDAYIFSIDGNADNDEGMENMRKLLFAPSNLKQSGAAGITGMEAPKLTLSPPSQQQQLHRRLPSRCTDHALGGSWLLGFVINENTVDSIRITYGGQVNQLPPGHDFVECRWTPNDPNTKKWEYDIRIRAGLRRAAIDGFIRHRVHRHGGPGLGPAMQFNMETGVIPPSVHIFKGEDSFNIAEMPHRFDADDSQGNMMATAGALPGGNTRMTRFDGEITGRHIRKPQFIFDVVVVHSTDYECTLEITGREALPHQLGYFQKTFAGDCMIAPLGIFWEYEVDIEIINLNKVTIDGWMQHRFDGPDGQRILFGQNMNPGLEALPNQEDNFQQGPIGHQRGDDSVEGNLEVFPKPGTVDIDSFLSIVEAKHIDGIFTLAPSSAPAGMMGEPHIKKWDGRWYDYMGECDLVLLDAPNFAEGLGLTIHTRTTIRYWYSYIETAAVMLGEDILEVSSRGEYKLNGISQAEMPGTLSDYEVVHRQESENKHSFTIDIDGLATLSIDTFKDLVSVNMHHINGATVDAWLGNSIGLMGSYGEGKMLARDGISILEDPNAMGQEWQVRDSEPKLFQVDRSPQFPQKCKLPTEKDQQEKRRRLEGTLSREDAERACAHWKKKDAAGCIYDVLATGDLELAEAGGY